MRERTEIVITILLLLAVLLALGLRLYQLDAQSLWYDEGFSAYLAHMDVAEITERTAADIQPPLYYYLLHAWIGLVGDDEIPLRGLSVLFGVLTVPLMYAVAWQLFRSRWAGLLAALLVAASPLHVWYSQEVRMYSLLTFLCLLSSYFLLLAIGAKKTWQNLALWPAYTLTSIAALYTHYFAFFVLAFQALYLFLVWSAAGFRPARLVAGGLISGVVTMLAYLPSPPHSLRYRRELLARTPKSPAGRARQLPLLCRWRVDAGADWHPPGCRLWAGFCALLDRPAVACDTQCAARDSRCSAAGPILASLPPHPTCPDPYPVV